MTAKEFFNQQSITDANSVIDKCKQKFTREELFKFAEAYHAAKFEEQFDFNPKIDFTDIPKTSNTYTFTMKKKL